MKNVKKSLSSFALACVLFLSQFTVLAETLDSASTKSEAPQQAVAGDISQNVDLSDPRLDSMKDSPASKSDEESHSALPADAPEDELPGVDSSSVLHTDEADKQLSQADTQDQTSSTKSGTMETTAAESVSDMKQPVPTSENKVTEQLKSETEADSVAEQDPSDSEKIKEGSDEASSQVNEEAVQGDQSGTGNKNIESSSAESSKSYEGVSSEDNAPSSGDSESEGQRSSAESNTSDQENSRSGSEADSASEEDSEPAEADGTSDSESSSEGEESSPEPADPTIPESSGQLKVFRYSDKMHKAEYDLKETDYYLPSNHAFKLLYQIPVSQSDSEVKITIKVPKKDYFKGLTAGDAHVHASVQEVKAFTKDEDGNLVVTFSKVKEGHIWFFLDVNGLSGEYGNSAEIGIQAEVSAEGIENTIENTKNFIVTKSKPVKDYSFEGPGKTDEPTEVNAGPSDGEGLIDKNKAKDIGHYSIGLNPPAGSVDWINGDVSWLMDNASDHSLRPDPVEISEIHISIDLPKYQGKFAEYVAKKGIPFFVDTQDGKVILHLKKENLDAELATDAEGHLLLNGEKLEGLENEVVLKKDDVLVYIDKNGKERPVRELNARLFKNEGFLVSENEIYQLIEGQPVLVAIFDQGQFKAPDGKKVLTFSFDKNSFVEAQKQDADKVALNDDGFIQYKERFKIIDGVTIVETSTGTAQALYKLVKGDKTGRFNVSFKRDEKKYYAGTILKMTGALFFDAANRFIETGQNLYEVIASTGIGEDGTKINVQVGPETQKDDKTYVQIDNQDYEVKDGVFTYENKKYRYMKNAVVRKEHGEFAEDVSFFKQEGKFPVIDKLGKLIANIIAYQEKGEWRLDKIDGGTTESKKGDADFSILNEDIIVDTNSEIKNSDNYHVYNGKHYKENGKYKNIEDKDLNNVSGGYLYRDKNLIELDALTTMRFTELPKEEGSSNKVITDISDKKMYSGSLNPKDYYKDSNGHVYLRDRNAEGMVLKSEDGRITYSDKPRSMVVQYDSHNNAIAYHEDSILELVKASRFDLNFSGFRPGKSFIYTLNSSVKASYLNPENHQRLELFENGETNHEIKKTKKLTLSKPKEPEDKAFGKIPPAEISGHPMDFNLFNLLFRSEDDRERDDLLTRLFSVSPDQLSEKDQDLRRLLESVYYEHYRKDLVWHEGKLQAESRDKDGNPIYEDLNRKLLWTIYVKSTAENGLPESDRQQIAIDDSHLDNRLVYERIIFNTIKEKYYEAKQEALKNKKPFKGNDKLFFIDEIEKIFFGVNPLLVNTIKDMPADGFIPVKGWSVSGETIVEKIVKIIKEMPTYGIKKQVELDNGQKIEVVLDQELQQVSLIVKNIFYDKDNQKSPVQIAYANEIDSFKNDIKKASEKWKTIEDVKNYLDKEVPNPGCKADLLKLVEKYEKSESLKDKDKVPKIKENIKQVLEQLELPDDIKGSDRRSENLYFNAFRVLIKNGVKVGGPDKANERRELGIGTVIADHVDIPFTDEYGRPLTNLENLAQIKFLEIIINKLDEEGVLKSAKNGREVQKHVNEEIEKMSSLELYNVWKEAYVKVLKKDDQINENAVKKLVTGSSLTGDNPYKALAGKDVDSDIFKKLVFKVKEENGKKTYYELEYIKDRDDKLLNPYYYLTKGGIKSIKELGFTDEDEKFTEAPINLIAYYLDKNGYNRSTFANYALLSILRSSDSKTLWENNTENGHGICHNGILGRCLYFSDSEDDTFEDRFKGDDAGYLQGESHITIEYNETNTVDDKVNRKFEKSADKSKLNVDSEKEEDKTISFTIKLMVDELPADVAAYKEVVSSGKNYAEVKKALIESGQYNPVTLFKKINHSLIIDLLPEELSAEKINFKLQINRDLLLRGNANKNLKDDAEFEAFKSGVELIYVSDLKHYMETLEGKRREILVNLLKDHPMAEMQGAVLAWLPEYEAPHGNTSPQFILHVNNLLLKKDVKLYTDPAQNLKKNESFFESKDYTAYSPAKFHVTSNPVRGNLDKYLRLYDEKGDLIKDPDTWFKGSAEVHFGQKFDYRVRYRGTEGIDTSDFMGGYSSGITNLRLTDILPQLEDGRGSTFRPSLAGPAYFDDKALGDILDIIYYADKDGQIELGRNQSELDFNQVLSIGIIQKQNTTLDPSKGFNLIIPMQVPELTVTLNQSKAVYENGERFDWESFKTNHFVTAVNTVENSNPVTVKLFRESLLKLFKQWQDHDRLLKDEELKELPAVEFVIYQVNESTGEKKEYTRIKLDSEHQFEGVLKNLPSSYTYYKYDATGKAVEKIEAAYRYEVEEVPVEGWESVQQRVEGDELGIVRLVTNKKKPDKPDEPEKPEKPEKPEEPEKPKVPEEPSKPKENKPSEPRKLSCSKSIPKTAAQSPAEGLPYVTVGLMIFLGLALFAGKRKG